MRENSKPKKLSPYFSFCKQHREGVKARLKNANQPVSAAALTKALSELWRSLSDAEKQKYNQQPSECADTCDLAPGVISACNQSPGRKDSSSAGKEDPAESESRAVPLESKELDDFNESKDVSRDGPVDQSTDRLSEENALAFPLARVKRIIKLDKEIRVVAADASTLIAHAAQLFLEHLTGTAYAAVIKRKRKTICLDDLKAGVKCESRVSDFLGDVLDDIFATEESAEDESDSDDGDEEADVSAPANQKTDTSKKRKLGKKPNPVPPVGNRRIADFFGNRSTLSEPSGSEAAQT